MIHERESAFLDQYVRNHGIHDVGLDANLSSPLPLNQHFPYKNSEATDMQTHGAEGRPFQLLGATDDTAAVHSSMQMSIDGSNIVTYQDTQTAEFAEKDVERQSLELLRARRESVGTGPYENHVQLPRTSRVPRLRVRPLNQQISRPSSCKGNGGESSRASPAVQPSPILGSTPGSVGSVQLPTPPSPAAGQQYPIRESVLGKAVGLSQSHDPLVEGLKSVVASLPQTLNSLLHGTTPSQDASPNLNRFGRSTVDSSNCSGFTGIGGCMVPESQTVAAAAPKIKTSAPTTPHPISTVPSQRDPLIANWTQTPTGTPTPPAQPANRESEEFIPQYCFVVNTPDTDPVTRGLVRQHVMKEHCRKMRYNQVHKKADGGISPIEPNLKPNMKRPGPGKRKVSAAETEAISHEYAGVEQRNSLIFTGGSVGSSPSSSPMLSRAGRKKHLADDDYFSHEAGRRRAASLPNYEHALEALEKNRNLPYTADPYAMVAASDVDPFSRLSVDMDQATRSLLHHFAWVMPSLMDEIVTGSVFHRLGWLYTDVAVHDPSPAHTILGYSLGHVAGLRGKPEPEVATKHKSEATQMVIKRMNDHHLSMSDELIGSIVHLAAWELIDCNPKHFSMHMVPLQEIVSERGGISCLGHKKDLQTILFRLDAIRAYVALSEPRFPTYEDVKVLKPLAINIPRTLDIKISHSNNDATHLPENTRESLDDTPESSFCEDSLQLLHTLEDVLLLLKSISYCEGKSFLRAKASIEASVRQCLKPAKIVPSKHAKHRSRRATRLAALVFIDAAAQHFFDGDAPDSGCRRLKAKLLGNGLDRTAMNKWGRSLEMVIHVLLAADRYEMEKPWRAWYFADALTLVMKIGDEQWEAVEGSLLAYMRERCEESESLVGPRSSLVWSVRDNYQAFTDMWAAWGGGAGSGVAGGGPQ